MKKLLGIKAPYPYFGGKSKIAPYVWSRLGADVPLYVEPFFGSGATLLARPALPDGAIERVNDLDGFICNFWRAVSADPERVAFYADYPSIENDLHARHTWLVQRRAALTEKLEADPDYFDAKIAGYWVWGMALWIGSGFCSGTGSWIVEEGRLVKQDAGNGQGVQRQRPHAGDNGQGIQRKLPHAGSNGRGIQRQFPHAGSNGQGIQRKLPHAGDNGQGIQRQLPHARDNGQGIQRKLPHAGDNGQGSALMDYMLALQERLKSVQVFCGDYTRLLKPAVTWGMNENNPTLTAVFLDPPYPEQGRSMVYNHETNVDSAVREWCLQYGHLKSLRIAYCTYSDPDCESRFPAAGWTAYRWKANGGMGSNRRNGANPNKYREVVWFSPHCLQENKQPSLF